MIPVPVPELPNVIPAHPWGNLPFSKVRKQKKGRDLQLVGNLASETTFDHWKVVFSSGKVRKTRFSHNPLNSRLLALGILIYTLSYANFQKIHHDKFKKSQSMFLSLVEYQSLDCPQPAPAPRNTLVQRYRCSSRRKSVRGFHPIKFILLLQHKAPEAYYVLHF